MLYNTHMKIKWQQHNPGGARRKGTGTRQKISILLDPAVLVWLKSKGEGQRNDVLNGLCFAAMRAESSSVPALLDEADAVLAGETL
jgi:hypothetical protein